MVEMAVSGVCAVAPVVRRKSAFDRAEVLDALARELLQNADDLATESANEAGYLTVQDMRLDVQRAVEVLKLTAAHVRTGMTESLNLEAADRARGVVAYVRREPIGPILGITAYNGPLLIAVHKLAPAIAAGAPIIIKPSPRVPLAAVRLARCVVAAGWPTDAVAVLDCDNATTMKLVTDPRLPVISFTGGGAFGWQLKGLVPHKHVHLELGGVGAVYVAEDGNVVKAAKECATGGYIRSGQSCISVQRIFVNRSRYDEFMENFVRHVQQLRAGTGSAIGPMVDEVAACRVEAIVADAVAKGAKVVCGGERNGSYIAPTVISEVTGEMDIMRHEVFGPVVAVAAVGSADEAIDAINSVSGAIQHGVYTADIDLAFRMADSLNAGGVIINGPGTWRVDSMPYGGTGTSGFGREGVRYAIEEFTQPKAIVVRPAETRSKSAGGGRQ